MSTSLRRSSLNSRRSAGLDPAVDWKSIEKILERFENAWISGQRPALEDYLTGSQAERRALLIELVHEDLEYRIRAGEAARVEEYLQRYPELRDRPILVIDLLATEFTARRHHGSACEVSEYLQRFPELGAALSSRLRNKIPEADTLPPVQASAQSTGQGSLRNEAAPADSPPFKGEAGGVAVPGYEILAELGRGGMGVVYKARQVQLQRTVALKMILAGGHAGRDELARFRIEAEAVARLQHPGIVQIHETGVHNGLPYFSLEFVEGGSLDRKLNGTPLPPNAAARLTALLAQAMQAAHEKGILHRDLKPANIFLMPVKEGGVPLEQRAAGFTP